MATLVLAAAGSALGASLGGGVLGVSSVVIGKAVGATLGAVIDQSLLGSGSKAIEVGRREQFRITGSTEGAPIARVFGQMRLGGQIIWSSRFLEDVQTSGGGKGTSAPKRRDYSYSVSLAIAVAEGEVTRIGRIWADGQVVDRSSLNLRLYKGTDTQLPDALIAASLPDGVAPAYRGIAYVVIEDLDLTSYGNRIPQFSFEVMRRINDDAEDAIDAIRGVALVPGTGEYALAHTPVSFEIDKGITKISNINNDEGRADIEVAVDNLVAEVPGCNATSLVVSWFGSDLRCDRCIIEPKVEQDTLDGAEMPWSVSGQPRTGASVVSQVDGRPGFGGTPADASVIEGISTLRDAGQAVMFYPFILMDIRAGNGLVNPWTGGAEQPPVPWRGRITTSLAPGVGGTTDKTAAATAEVAAFFGAAAPGDFTIDNGSVVYSGPNEWSYRRFILHYAHLCAAAGGVDAFCIGSEMRALTQVRDGPGSFPAVAALRVLAAEVRSILGPDTKIGYAADWSEYFGYQPGDGSGDVYYHLDPLWADPQIDFIGIDNYMPLSDWRDVEGHADEAFGSIYDLDYLTGNVAGGEGYDWFYASPEARDAQIRTPITDGAYDMPWVYRYKDLLSWWSRAHYNRPGGALQTPQTDWLPESKPIWFTELGCPAVDKGTNQPNVFLDPQSSENNLPYYSDGGQDRFIQRRYLQAVLSYWADPENNPVSRNYNAPMVDMDRAFVWAWDARPWPDYPQKLDVWSDGLNHARGHWISGRSQFVELGQVVGTLCAQAGLEAVDVSDLDGMLQGYDIGGIETIRESLQPLMLAYGFDAYEREGQVVFRNRTGTVDRVLDVDDLVSDGTSPRYELSRLPEAEVPARVRLEFVHPHKDYQAVTAEAQMPGAEALFSSGSQLPVALSHSEGTAIAARWLAETQVGRDRVTLALGWSSVDLGPGDVVGLEVGGRVQSYRIDRVEEASARQIEAVRVEADHYQRVPQVPELIASTGENGDGKPYVAFMDLPLLTGDGDPVAPWIAAAQTPWPGPMAVFGSAEEYDYREIGDVSRSSVVGTTLTALPAVASGRWSGQILEVSIPYGTLESRTAQDVLNGANSAALRPEDGDAWEVIQFQKAELIGSGQYALTGLLRGQAGTEGEILPILPAGADFVLLDGGPVQVDQSIDTLGLERHFRVGPADLSYDDARYRHLLATPTGVGLRPYAPAHLRARADGGSIRLSWIRRTRIGGDSWMLADVPLSEQTEAYRVTVMAGTSVLRIATSTTPAFEYTAAMQAADGGTGPLTFGVAQISDTYGPGHEARILFNE
ncbi:MAG: glycoside hydrolase/phage tail family protein [Pseudomonadota bacterium]